MILTTSKSIDFSHDDDESFLFSVMSLLVLQHNYTPRKINIQSLHGSLGVSKYYEIPTKTAKLLPIIAQFSSKHTTTEKFSILILIMPHFLRAASRTV